MRRYGVRSKLKDFDPNLLGDIADFWILPFKKGETLFALRLSDIKKLKSVKQDSSNGPDHGQVEISILLRQDGHQFPFLVDAVEEPILVFLEASDDAIEPDPVTSPEGFFSECIDDGHTKIHLLQRIKASL